MEIFIIRHTPVDVPKGTCYGQSNVFLNDSFKEYLEKYLIQLPHDFDAVYSSPLERCKVLADKFSEQVIIDDRLQELNFGDWEMKLWNTITFEESKEWFENYDIIPPPNGETFNDLYTRITTFYEDLKLNKNFKKVLIVTHAGPIRCFWTKILANPLKNAFKIPIGFGEILRIDLDHDVILQKG